MAKNIQFVIAEGQSLSLNTKGMKVKKDHLVSGDEVPMDLLNREQLKRLMREGVIRVKDQPVESDPEKLLRIDETGTLVEAGVAKAEKVKADLAAPITTETPAAEVKHETAAAGEPIRHRGLWDHDPDLLAGKSLESLNVLIKERDPNGPICASVADAIKHLSQDYQQPKKTTELRASGAAPPKKSVATKK